MADKTGKPHAAWNHHAGHGIQKDDGRLAVQFQIFYYRCFFLDDSKLFFDLIDFFGQYGQIVQLLRGSFDTIVHILNLPIEGCRKIGHAQSQEYQRKKKNRDLLPNIFFFSRLTKRQEVNPYHLSSILRMAKPIHIAAWGDTFSRKDGSSRLSMENLPKGLMISTSEAVSEARVCLKFRYVCAPAAYQNLADLIIRIR